MSWEVVRGCAFVLILFEFIIIIGLCVFRFFLLSFWFSLFLDA